MSAAAVAPLHCCICQHPLQGRDDTRPIRDKRGTMRSARCSDYENCMLRAARNRRAETVQDGRLNAAS